MADEVTLPYPIRGWAYGVQWKESFKVTYEALTEILVSRSKYEQRIANRRIPRKYFEFTSVVKRDSRRDFHGFQAKWRARPVIVPEFSLYVTLTSPATIGATSLNVSEVTSWMSGEQRFIALEHTQHWGFGAIDYVAGSTIALQEPLDENWPTGTKVYCGVVGRMDRIAVTEETDDVWTVECQISCAPVQPEEDYSAGEGEVETWNGREVMDRSPNWGVRPTSDFDFPFESIDYRRGRREFFYPGDFLVRLRNFTIMLKDRAQGVSLRNFFYRMNGRQDEFYMSTGSDDLPLLSKTSTTLTVAGRSVYDDYEGDRVFTSICVALRGGEKIYRRVTGIALAGGNSVLTVDSPWAFNNADVRMISWFPVWRLASDRMTVEWLTDSVGQVQVSIVMLEDLEGD